MLCYYVRGVGATVVVSMVLWLLFHRQMRGAIVIGGVSAVLIGLWQVRNAIALPVTIYSYQFFLKDQENYSAGTIGFTDLLARMSRATWSTMCWRDSWTSIGPDSALSLV